MGVTVSTAAERRQRQPSSRLPGLRPPGRLRETVLLGGALAVLLLGLGLLYSAVTRPFGEIDAALAGGEILDLNSVQEAEQLVPFLAFLSEPAERSFVARRIWRRLQEGDVPNVGELAKIRVAASEIENESRLPSLSARLEALREDQAQAQTQAQDQEAAAVEDVSLRLLTNSQIREIKPRLVVRQPAGFRSQLWLWTGLLFAGFLAIHLVWRARRFAGDELLLPVLLTLTGIGLMVSISVRDPLRDLLLFRTFAQGVLAGCALLLAASLVRYERSPLRRATFLPLLIAFGLSVLLIVFGSGPGGSDAKVNLFGFQPVEAIKILVVLFLAGYFFERWEFLRELPERRAGLSRLPGWARVPKIEYVATPIAALGVVLAFFFLQRDLGPALVLSFLFLLLYCVARGRARMLALGSALVVGAFVVGYRLGVPRTVTGRISMWLHPWDNSFRGGDHLAQSLWAVASGSLTGMGLGLGDPARVPEVHTDMVLAAIGEELGFLGVLAVFALYALLIQRGFRAARRAEGAYSFFLALGLTLLTALHILLIAGGVFGLFPLSGVVSPFLSSGRSAMLANFLLAGALAAISANPGEAEAHRRFQGSVRGVALGLAVIGGAILLRAAQVQVLQGDSYLTRGALTLQADGLRRFQYNPRLEEIAETIPRGAIVDRNGIPLATNDPALLAKHRTVLQGLGVSLDPGKPRAAGADPGRLYPFEGKTYHLLGDLRTRTNWAASNTSYAERDSRIRLQGYDDYAAVTEVEQPDGKVTELVRFDYGELVPLLRHRYQPGHDDVKRILNRDRTVKMTIDARLQARAAEIVRRYAAGHGAAAVVLDAETGDLLASVSYPWPERLPFKPSEENPAEGIDRARYGLYPPGSTFKMVTAMAALRAEPELARKTFVCQRLPDGRVGNRVRGWGRAIRDDVLDKQPHGAVDLHKGIVVSCNAYFAQLGTYEVKAENLLETAQLMKITTARPNTPEQLQDALPQAAYGQGQVTATPFQMARVAATIARGGTMPEGRWILDASNPRKAEPQAILSASSTSFLARSMREVVTQGTASRILGGVQPPIAGKTGTAEVRGKASHSWFIGFAPMGGVGGVGGAESGGRRIAFAVIVEHGGYGGRLAAQASGEIVRAASELGLLANREGGGTAE